MDREMPPVGETALDMAYTNIRDDLLGGSFEPAAKLRVEALCERYGLGPTPVREALARLSASGLVVATPNRGYRAAAVSRAEYRELVDLRLRLEPDALAQSVRQGDLDWEARVAAAYQRLVSVQNHLRAGAPEARRDWAREDRGFHLALLSNCGSAWLLRFCGNIYDHTARYHRDRIRDGVAPARKTEDEHKLLLTAALRRDAEAAAEALRTHIQNVAVRIERAL